MQHYLLQFAAALITKDEIGLPGPKSDKGLIENVLLPVYFWAGALAVIIIIVSGFLYVLSNGNPQQVTRAKNAIIAAVVGLIFVLIAFGITTMVLGAVS
jgi:hypothetical protein